MCATPSHCTTKPVNRSCLTWICMEIPGTAWCGDPCNCTGFMILSHLGKCGHPWNCTRFMIRSHLDMCGDPWNCTRFMIRPHLDMCGDPWNCTRFMKWFCPSTSSFFKRTRRLFSVTSSSDSSTPGFFATSESCKKITILLQTLAANGTMLNLFHDTKSAKHTVTPQVRTSNIWQTFHLCHCNG